MAYTIISTQQVQRMAPNGVPQTVYRVSVQTDRGSTGDVDIAERDWNAERIAEIVAEFADTLDLAYLAIE